MKGYIKFHRSFWDCGVFRNNSDPFTEREAWLWLFSHANYKPAVVNLKGVDFIVDRGEVLFSTRSLSQKWRWTRAKVRRFLNKLEKHKMIRVDNLKTTTKIDIINFDKYQDDTRLQAFTNAYETGPPTGPPTGPHKSNNTNTIQVKPAHQPAHQPAIDNIILYSNSNNEVIKGIRSTKNTKGYLKENFEERKREFTDKTEEYKKDSDSQEMIEDFVRYWTATNEGCWKMAFEKEKTFSIKGRLETFRRNQKKWSKNVKKTNGHNISDERRELVEKWNPLSFIGN